MFGCRRIKYKAIKSSCKDIVNICDINGDAQDLCNKIIKLFSQIDDKFVILIPIGKDICITFYRNGKYMINKAPMFFVSDHTDYVLRPIIK